MVGSLFLTLLLSLVSCILLHGQEVQSVHLNEFILLCFSLSSGSPVSSFPLDGRRWGAALGVTLSSSGLLEGSGFRFAPLSPNSTSSGVNSSSASPTEASLTVMRHTCFACFASLGQSGSPVGVCLLQRAEHFLNKVVLLQPGNSISWSCTTLFQPLDPLSKRFSMRLSMPSPAP